MYAQLCTRGEVVMIEERTAAGICVPVGDVTLAANTLPIVLRREARGRGIGRLVLGALVARARDLGWAQLEVREIQPGNAASTALFRGAGFVPNVVPAPAMSLDLRS